MNTFIRKKTTERLKTMRILKNTANQLSQTSALNCTKPHVAGQTRNVISHLQSNSHHSATKTNLRAAN